MIEIMIALVLGILLSTGIFSIFQSTSNTAKLQNGLARLQENGRFALTRMEADLRMTGAQYCSNSSGAGTPVSGRPLLPGRAPMVYAPSIDLPDSDIGSINAAGNPVAGPSSVPYALSPRWFVQGYDCSAGPCSPALPGGSGIPAASLADGARVPRADVLTVRYLRGSGWPVPGGACGVASDTNLQPGNIITLDPQVGDDPLNFAAGDLALISDCADPVVLPTAGATGDDVEIGNVLSGVTGTVCGTNTRRDRRMFNFSRDFVTITYYLIFRADENPDARPNGGGAQRLIPTLIRRENGVDQELVRGVDNLRFLYGVVDDGGDLRFMTARQVQAATNCPPPPAGMTPEPGCMWRSVTTIEPHLLLNSVDEIMRLDAISRSYRFNGTAYNSPAETATLDSGLRNGNLLRREFVSYVSARPKSF